MLSPVSFCLHSCCSCTFVGCYSFILDSKTPTSSFAVTTLSPLTPLVCHHYGDTLVDTPILNQERIMRRFNIMALIPFSLFVFILGCTQGNIADVPTPMPTATATPSPTATPTPTLAPTATPLPTPTPTAVPTATPTATPTQVPTPTPEPTP